MMKKIITILLTAMTMLVARAEYGEMNISGYYTRAFKTHMDGVGISFKGHQSYRLRRVMSLEYYFRKEGLSCYAFNYDTNYVWEVGQRMRLFPAMGVQLALWQSHGDYDPDKSFMGMDKKNKLKLGLHFGAGAECLINAHWLIGIEAKYQFMHDVSNQLVVSAGLSYRF